MLPPVEASVLEANPQFASLYKILTASILNPDGTTKNDPAKKEREAIEQKLRKHRLRAARHHLLISAIATAHPNETVQPTVRRPRALSQPAPPSQPPPDLLDLLLILPPLLAAPPPLPASDTALLLSTPPLSNLPVLLPHLAALLSATLAAAALPLARLASPATNPSYLHRAVPALPAHAASQRAAAAAEGAPPLAVTRAAAAALARLLAERAVAVRAAARALEAKHANPARGLALRAAELATAARAQHARADAARAAARSVMYPPGAAAALAAYARHLRDGRGRLAEEVAGLGAEVEGYCAAGGKERVMREMARVYGEMEREIEEVRADLERLGRA